jgi:hypothetical protein
MDESISKGETKVGYCSSDFSRLLPKKQRLKPLLRIMASTDVPARMMFLCGNSFHFYMDISDKLMYIPL